MVQDVKEEIYEINEKKYKVITRCIENSQSADKCFMQICNIKVTRE